MTSEDDQSNQPIQTDCVFLILCQDRQGKTRCMRARGIDISETGARVQVDEPIDPRSHVFVEAEQYNLIFSASVRYCTRLGSKFLLGLRFSAAG